MMSFLLLPSMPSSSPRTRTSTRRFLCQAPARPFWTPHAPFPASSLRPPNRPCSLSSAPSFGTRVGCETRGQGGAGCLCLCIEACARGCASRGEPRFVPTECVQWSDSFVSSRDAVLLFKHGQPYARSSAEHGCLCTSTVAERIAKGDAVARRLWSFFVLPPATAVVRAHAMVAPGAGLTSTNRDPLLSHDDPSKPHACRHTKPLDLRQVLRSLVPVYYRGTVPGGTLCWDLHCPRHWQRPHASCASLDAAPSL